MNDTTPAIGPIKSVEKLQASYWKSTAHNKKREGTLSPQLERGAGSGQKQQQREREQFAFTQNSTGLANWCKNEIILVPVAITDNEFSAQQTQATST